MKIKITWKKDLFGNKYEILFGDSNIGELVYEVLEQKYLGCLNQKKIIFRIKYGFNQIIEIIDFETNTIIGLVKPDIFSLKTIIEVSEKRYSWNFVNFWQTKWHISESKNELLNYSGNSLSGTISFDNGDEMLILLGLFIANYHWENQILIP